MKKGDTSLRETDTDLLLGQTRQCKGVREAPIRPATAA